MSHQRPHRRLGGNGQGSHGIRERNVCEGLLHEAMELASDLQPEAVILHGDINASQVRKHVRSLLRYAPLRAIDLRIAERPFLVFKRVEKLLEPRMREVGDD